MPPAQAQSYQYHTSAAAAATSGTGRSLPVPRAHMQYDADEWQRPPNAANMQHAVDFRRSWVPSPEMRDLFPLPPSGERYPVLHPPQTYMAATQTHTHPHPQRPAMPPTARARRAEGGRALHRQSQSYSQPSGAFAGDELSSFARTRPRAATVTGAGTRTEMSIGNGSALGMANGAANGMTNGMANGTTMSMVNGRQNGMANGSPMRMVNGSAMGMVNGSAMGMVNGSAMGMVNGSASGSARHLLHTTSTGGPREQAPEARQVWRSVHESQVQRELHAGGRAQEPVPEPVPERAGDLRRTANRRRNVNGAGSGRPKSWLSLFHPKRLFSTSACTFPFFFFHMHVSCTLRLLGLDRAASCKG
ncbi:hypothetical protein K466DRAFT_170420 [Polyporus arcularius HHB13444]|uniref:Uncharacterized protein n=1 Tax=Polyporus arcularius HHB13444 TaxID=1314778 RepID=A0A5C3P8J3_9APHY|nr:hypothetical protein K466DRAFT_170420 [Polyporus arcularius HHB13444]